MLDRVPALDDPGKMIEWSRCPRASVPDWCWNMLAWYQEWDKRSRDYIPGLPMDEQPWWFVWAMRLIHRIRNRYEAKQYEEMRTRGK